MPAASHGRFARPGAGLRSAGSTRDRPGAGTSRQLHASRVACLVLTSIQEGKNNPQNPLQFFFQPHMPKAAKKSRVKRIQGLKVMMRATVMQRRYVYTERHISFFPVTCNLGRTRLR